MLFLIFGTNHKKRKLAKEKIRSSLLKKEVIFEELLEMPKINPEESFLLQEYFQYQSLFGEKVLVNGEGFLATEASRDFLYKNLEKMVESENVFIFDEPLALAVTFKKLERELEKLGLKENAFDASEEKTRKDINPFPLCDFLEDRNKKLAWQEWKNICLEWGDKEAMALHGAVWWKWKNLWLASLDGNKNNYSRIYRLKNQEIKYSIAELASFGKEIAFMAMRATNGELDLMRSLEALILKI